MKAPSYALRLIWPVLTLASILATNVLQSADASATPSPAPAPTYTSASLALHDLPAQPAPMAISGNSGPFDRWTLINSGEATSYYGLRWIKNQFVALGAHAIMVSPDGITWKNTDSALTGSFYDIATDGKIFVAVGDKGVLATSPDLNKWTHQPSLTTSRTYGVYWFNGQFLATGDSGALYSSTDGAVWTSRQLGGSYFHHGTLAGTGLVLADSDGITTTDLSSRRHYSTTSRMMDVAFNGNVLAAVGPGPDILMVSADGLSWQRAALNTDQGLSAVTWTGTQFVAGGSNTSIFISPDGGSWSKRSLGGSGVIYGLAGHGDTIVAVTSSGEIYTNQNVATVVPPEISFAPGPAGAVPQLELKCSTTDAKIFFTEDGKDPTPHSTPYTAPFSPAQSETIEVRAYKDGLAQSAISTADFIVNPPKVQP